MTDSQVVQQYIQSYNLRGITTGDIVADIQNRTDTLLNEVETETKLIHSIWIRKLTTELLRREQMTYDGIRSSSQSIIQAIKEKSKIEDVIAWYAEVGVYQKQWNFKCPVHGDTHPSGKIYPDQQSWWCFGCNTGGDIFDAVMWFARVDMPTALKKLARHVGLELDKPKTKKPIEQRMEELENTLYSVGKKHKPRTKKYD